MRCGASLVALWIVPASVDSEAQTTKLLTAPTFYIAASGEYSKFSSSVEVKGASNLPPGSLLSITLYDFIGYRSTILSEDAVVRLNDAGFFEATLRPRPGKQFKDNMVCDIAFIPRGVTPQNASVLKVVGKQGYWASKTIRR